MCECSSKINRYFLKQFLVNQTLTIAFKENPGYIILVNLSQIYIWLPSNEYIAFAHPNSIDTYLFGAPELDI